MQPLAFIPRQVLPQAHGEPTRHGNLQPLERRGLLTVTPGVTDRRSRRLALTESGRTLLLEALPAWERAQAEIERRFANPDGLGAGLRALF